MSTKFGSMKNRGMRRNGQMSPPGFRNPSMPQMPQPFNQPIGPQTPTARQQAANPMNQNQIHPQLLLQQQLLIQQLALQNLQVSYFNPKYDFFLILNFIAQPIQRRRTAKVTRTTTGTEVTIITDKTAKIVSVNILATHLFR